jgi:hypothetical protein
MGIPVGGAVADTTHTASSLHARSGAPARLGFAGQVSVLLYLAFCGLVTLMALTRPIANWDALPYAASVMVHQGETDPAALHRRAYALVQAHVSPTQFHELTSSLPYRAAQAASAENFVSMLPMYQVKGGYIATLSVLSRFGDIVTAGRALSLAAILVMLGMLLWSFHALGALHLIGFTVPMLAALRVIDLATTVTPDAVVAALGVSAMALIAVAGRLAVPAPALALLVLAVLFRPDMAVVTSGLPIALVSGGALAAFLAGQPIHRALTGAVRTVGAGPWLAALGGAVAYMLAKAGIAHPGWWTHFNFSFVAQPDNLSGPALVYDWRVHASAIARSSLRMLREENWGWMMLAMLLATLMWAKARAIPPVLLGLALAAIGSVAARTLAFPLTDARIAVLPVLTLAIVAAGIIGAGRPARDGPGAQA